jgi:hypothetical protein
MNLPMHRVGEKVYFPGVSVEKFSLLELYNILPVGEAIGSQ